METILTSFLASPQSQLSLGLLSSNERRAIHELCEKLGCFSQSTGNGERKVVTVTKTKSSHISPDEIDMFIKDFGLPIPINTEPYFSHYIRELDPMLGTIAKFELFKYTLGILAERRLRFKTFSFDLRDKIVTAINNVRSYREFVASKLENVDNAKISKATITTPGVYISLDLIKANYSCLREHDSDIVLGTSTWEELVGKFTDLEYFTKAKYFRQLVFGNLNTKRIESLQRRHLVDLYSKISDRVKVVGRAGNDELYLSTDGRDLNDMVDYLKEVVGPMWRITVFRQDNIGKTEFYTTQEVGSDEIKIKGVSKDFYVQAYKYLKKKDLHPYDLTAMKEGRIISYVEPYLFE